MKTLAPKTLNYIPGSQSFADGFLGPKGNVGYMMYADYGKAKEIIEALLQTDRSIVDATMGLDGDWDCNSTVIWDGEFHEYDSHGSSIWAAPIMIVTFKDSPAEMYPVWSKTK